MTPETPVEPERAPPQPKVRKRRPGGDRYDWEGIERAFRSGAYSTQEIADHYGCTRQAIIKRAKLHGWVRDLTPRVQARVKSLLTEVDAREPLPEPVPITPAVSGEIGSMRSALEDKPVPEIAIPSSTAAPEVLAAEDVAVENAAQRTVAVIREHRVTASFGRALVLRMMHELDVVTSRHEELAALLPLIEDDPARRGLMRKALSLPQRASTMHNLSEAARKWIEIERKVFNIRDDDGRQAYEDALRALLAQG